MANEMAIEDYKQVMRLALEGVHARHKSPQGLWLDSCHLIAYSLLYDITIFVYSAQLQCWSAYNCNGRNEWVTSIYNGWHFDAVQPVIPRAVLRQGYLEKADDVRSWGFEWKAALDVCVWRHLHDAHVRAFDWNACPRKSRLLNQSTSFSGPLASRYIQTYSNVSSDELYQSTALV
jgi:hypothetical protein